MSLANQPRVVCVCGCCCGGFATILRYVIITSHLFIFIPFPCSSFFTRTNWYCIILLLLVVIPTVFILFPLSLLFSLSVVTRRYPGFLFMLLTAFYYLQVLFRSWNGSDSMACSHLNSFPLYIYILLTVLKVEFASAFCAERYTNVM